MEINRKQQGESNRQKTEEKSAPPTEELASTDPEPDLVSTPLQLELYEFQQSDEPLDADPVFMTDEPLPSEPSITDAMIVEPTRPTQPGEPVKELPLPIDRARQLIEIAAAKPMQSTESIANPQIEATASPTIESVDGQVSAIDFSDLNLPDQSGNSSFSTASSSQTPEIELPSSVQAPEVVKNVTATVAENLVQQVELTESGANRKLVVQLHPAELGQVMLQVDWENETLKAKILTNEAAATELLNQNKQQLVQALAENGISFDSLDVAYQDAPNEQTTDEDSARLPGGSESTAEAEAVQTKLQIPTSSTTMVDIVV